MARFKLYLIIETNKLDKIQKANIVEDYVFDEMEPFNDETKIMKYRKPIDKTKDTNSEWNSYSTEEKRRYKNSITKFANEVYGYRYHKNRITGELSFYSIENPNGICDGYNIIKTIHNVPSYDDSLDAVCYNNIILYRYNDKKSFEKKMY